MPFRGWRAWTILALAVLGVMAGAQAAAAQISDDLGVIGQLQYQDANGNKVFVEGVELTIDGVGSSTTDAEGKFRIPVSGPGEYDITLNIETLPSGVALKDATRGTIVANVSENNDQRVIFALIEGDSTAVSESKFSARRIGQLTLEGIKLGLYLAMAAIGLSLIFGTTGLVNFAHAEMVTWGALMTYFFNVYGLVGAIGLLAGFPAPLGGPVNFILATMLSMVAGAVLGYVLNRVIFRTSRDAGVSLL
ncbi:MAG: ABC transporter permease subunit, partial [Actinomycetota bacterium]